MQTSTPAVILTTIFQPNAVMHEIASQCEKHGWDFIIAGDSKSPKDFQIDGVTFLDVQKQKEMGKFGRLCPDRTYAKKNLAYLEAIRRRAPWIAETDDDNMPGPEFWKIRSPRVEGRVADTPGWVNAYRYFSNTFIYPRGYPIDLALPHWQGSSEVKGQRSEVSVDPVSFSASQLFPLSESPIQQSLADDNPDVDAVYRMLHPLPFQFRRESPLVLGKGAWCPFNSQNTVFFPEAYQLLYLPVTCSFRMTDIWRSFIAQRLLWTCDWRLSFHSASVTQERNEHDLLRDFEEEISGYLGNKKIIAILESLNLKDGAAALRQNMEACYQALLSEGFFKPEEEGYLAAWLDDISESLH